MINLSRRSLLSSTGMVGASLLATPSEVYSETRLAPPSYDRGSESIITSEYRKAAADSLLSYFRHTAPGLLKAPRGVLQHKWISPSLSGAAYSTQLWDWDTYWTARGLFKTSHLIKDDAFHRDVATHAQGSLMNFLDHQSGEGRIPTMISVDNADYFGNLRRASPPTHNQAKPVFGQLALLIAEEIGDVQWLASRFDHLLRFYDSWVLGNGASLGLLVWGEDVAIGVDNDPTSFGRPVFSAADLTLNCLYYQDLIAASKIAKLLNRTEDSERLSERARRHGESILKHCWDPRDRFFYTVDVQCHDRRAELLPGVPMGMSMSWQSLPLRIQMFTGFLPLWCGLATSAQAGDLVKLHYLNKETFSCFAGVRSLSAQETMYSLAKSSNPSNWLGPVWILVNYVVWKGLKTYGFTNDAKHLSDKTLRLLASDLARSGTLNEYYNPDSGLPLSYKGFMDWNLLVTEMVSED